MSESVLRQAPVGARVPVHVWILGGISLLWGAMGGLDYTATQMRMDWYLGQFTAEQVEYFTAFPAWVDAAWAFGVWGGLAGALGLLLRRAWSVWAYAVSFAGMVGSFVYMYFLTDGAQIVGQGAALFSGVILGVGALYLVYVVWLRKRGVLR